MSLEEVLVLANKISEVLEKEKNAKFPCKEKFDEINTKLSEIRPKISSASLLREQADQLRDVLGNLDNILTECLALSNQRQNVKKSLASAFSAFKQVHLRNRLRKVENALQVILQCGIEEEVITSPHPSSLGNEHQEEDDQSDYYEWTCSYVDEDMLYGDKNDAKEIVDELVKNNDFNAVGIVGSYGSGKTNLARKVFIDERVKDEFPLRLWVCVGPECKKEELLYRMLDNLGLETDEVEDIVQKSKAFQESNDKASAKIGVLLFILHLQLVDVKYLIVFDDVRITNEWYRNLASEPPINKVWDDRLGYGLPKGNGSAVVVTCRKERDARTMVETGRIFIPKELKVEDGWALFKRAFDEAKKNSNHVEEGLEDKLSEMKEQIVKKCLGFPAALIAAGRGLATQPNPYDD